MKATGIVRRIDELGRIVIPKEIRRTLRIREGDSLEIFTDREGEIILKKYSPLGELSTFSAEEKRYRRVIAEQDEEYLFQAVCPILCEGDVVGSVILLTKDPKKKFGETEKMLARTAAGFLGRQMEQ